jgi:asparagine synthase (glutamine-hydrolysing)
VPGNKESEYSKRVAEALGFKWVFVEYSDAAWTTAWQSEDRWQYQLRASAWTSVPHMQDWLAVRILKERELVDNQCIFVPGHTGDFISGGHIPLDAFSKNRLSNVDLVSAINYKHYRLAPRAIDTPSAELCTLRILSRANVGEIQSDIEYSDAFEKWEWQERQAKFIVNSIRVYEFYGYSWWLPFWDLEFMRLWQNVPLALRRERWWYKLQVDTIYINNSSDVDGKSLGNADDYSVRAKIAKITRLPYFRNPLAKSVMNFVRGLFTKSVGPTHLSWKARYPSKDVVALIAAGYSSLGINAHDVLASMVRELDHSID